MNASEQYQEAKHNHREAAKRSDHAEAEKQGKRLREAALERADRRVWAHKRKGDESRWAE